jgi:hypothetical protein
VTVVCTKYRVGALKHLETCSDLPAVFVMLCMLLVKVLLLYLRTLCQGEKALRMFKCLNYGFG